ncbi:MAG: hypothetical protein ABEJ23_06010 [Haloarculaceae archaeon]
MNARASTSPDKDAHGANTLLLAPAFDDGEDAVCADMLGVAEPGETDALFVTLTASPDARIDHWRTRVSPSPPANLGVVSVDESTRSAAARSASATTANGHVRSVSSPGDLTGLGIAISEYLSEWHGDGNRTVVCFHSLTPLLQYADARRVFQFLHVLTRRVESADAVAHYHLDPSAHDERTVRMLSSLFDEVVDAGDRHEDGHDHDHDRGDVDAGELADDPADREAEATESA